MHIKFKLYYSLHSINLEYFASACIFAVIRFYFYQRKKNRCALNFNATSFNKLNEKFMILLMYSCEIQNTEINQKCIFVKNKKQK